MRMLVTERKAVARYFDSAATL